jgi:hypothetical protein
MIGAPSTVDANDNLRKLALAYLCDLRRRHANWFLEDVLESLKGDNSPELAEMAVHAGFRPKTEPSAREVALVLPLLTKYPREESIISKESGLPEDRVRAVFLFCQAGQGDYGVCVYGSRKVSDGITDVQRRITATGQFSYRGKLYTIGVQYRGKIATLKEQGKGLVVTCKGMPQLKLTLREDR